MPKISPFLWFNNNAVEAAAFYCSIFPNSRRLDTKNNTEDTPGPTGEVMVVSFELDGQKVIALNGGPRFTFSEAVSLVVPCKDQAEIDYYWNALTADGGQPSQCGWLKDKFGFSWQVVPENINQLLSSPAAVRALMTMSKIDIAALQNAS